ncbi:TonB-dependent receptor [Prosthecochloris sp. CIB 2401]|uniref:TonB-dependent receptor n=1 Tax=Prosthecochloris sp. CIB 2401 TaxID=1868325 RepID=UPI00080AA5F1|nr:TonB-dependent receptor [Prosthecochloris sp. CIB 2401]ANT65774.1 Hemin receptor precursor [Prosthecochloris sp. CIB 2401]
MEQQHSRLAPISRSIFSTLTAAIISMPLYATAADFGVLKGTITDRNDGEPVIGASVMLENTTIGAASDFDGNYSIMEIPAGTYSLKVSGVGYAPLVQKVTVPAGETATLNLKLAETTIMASEVIVGAALYEQDRLDIPVTASVVSEEELHEESSSTLADAVAEVPGVVVNRAGGYGTSTVQIRGSNTFQGGAIGTRVQGLYDGFPVNNPTTGEVVWTNVNMNAASKVEILKGAAATLYGSGAMGGVINVYGSMPDEFEVKAGISGGFYDSPPDSDQSTYYEGYTPWLWNTYVGIGDKRGDLNYSFLYSHADDDGFRANTNTMLDDLKFKARYDIDASQYIQLTSFYNETEGGYPTTWPYTNDFSTGAPIQYADKEIRYDITNPVYDDDIIKRKNVLVGLNYVNLLSDDLSLDTKLYYTRNETRTEYNPTDTPQIFSISYNRLPGEFNEDIVDRYGTGVKLDYRINDQHRLLFGMDGNISDVESTRYTAEVPTEHPLDDSALNDIQEKNAALFLQDEFKPTDKLTVLASVRYDWSGIDADEVNYVDQVTPTMSTEKTAEIENSSVDAISPRIAMNYRATDNMAFRASWGKSFRAPTLAERFVTDAGLWKGNPNPALDKETMTAWEVGMFTALTDRVSFDIAGYINNYDDLIESVFYTNSSGDMYFQYENFRKARIWGIETSLNTKPLDNVAVNFGYSYMNATIQDYAASDPKISIDYNTDPEWLPMRPEHTASISATWNATNRLTLNTTGRYVSEYKAVNVYTRDYDSYPGDFIIFNLGTKYQFTDFLSGSFLCKNITNEQYSEAEWFPSPGRSYVFGMDFVF